MNLLRPTLMLDEVIGQGVGSAAMLSARGTQACVRFMYKSWFPNRFASFFGSVSLRVYVDVDQVQVCMHWVCEYAIEEGCKFICKKSAEFFAE